MMLPKHNSALARSEMSPHPTLRFVQLRVVIKIEIITAYNSAHLFSRTFRYNLLSIIKPFIVLEFCTTIPWGDIILNILSESR